MSDLYLSAMNRDELNAIVGESVAKEIRRALAEQSPPLLVDADEMSRLAGVSRATIDRLRSNGVIPSVLVARRRLYRPEAVIAALEAQNEKGGQAND